MFKELHKPTTPPTTHAQAKPSRSKRDAGKPKAHADQPNGLPAEAKPAARFMQTGGAPKPAGQQPAYKLRQKLDDLDLQLKHPHLDRKWRKKIGGVPQLQAGKVVRGRQGSAKAQQDEQVYVLFGLRKGELLGQRWSSIDYENQLFTVDQQVHELDGM